MEKQQKRKVMTQESELINPKPGKKGYKDHLWFTYPQFFLDFRFKWNFATLYVKFIKGYFGEKIFSM